MMWRGLILIMALGGCGFLRPSTGNELMDAVLIRADPFGDCVAVDDPPLIFKDVGGPMDPPLLLTPESFEHPDVRAAAAAIAISYPSYVWPDAEMDAAQNDGCTMDVSTPAYSGSFAFVDYMSPNGVFGVYAFRKDGADWRVVEHKKIGNW